MKRNIKILRLIVFTGVVFVILLEFYVSLQKDSASALNREPYYASEYITIESIDDQPRVVFGNEPFSRYEGDAFGLGKHIDFSSLDFVGPFHRASAIASGDFNNDNWQDIVFGDRKGILLYKNLGTGNFELQNILIPEIEDLSIIVAAFVDINNDGWQDIYITSYGGINYFILNDKVGFQYPVVLKTPNGKAIVTHSTSFSDLNRDGNLDFVNGNWVGGTREYISKLGENKLVINKNLQFLEENLPEPIGESLSVLLVDFTNDDKLDLIVGNDFDVPDIFYIGDEGSGLKKILRNDSVIPISAYATMSVDVADYNNDLYMDIYISGISEAPVHYCLEVRNILESQICKINLKINEVVRYTKSVILNPTMSSFNNNLKISEIVQDISGIVSKPHPYLFRGKDHCLGIKNITERQTCERNLKIREIVKERDVESCALLADEKDKNDCISMVLFYIAVKDMSDETLCRNIPEGYSVLRKRCHDFFNLSFVYGENEKEGIEQRGFGSILLAGSKEGLFREILDEPDFERGSVRGGWAWNAKFADIDNDEWQDIYVVNGRWETSPTSNVFFHNYEGNFFKPEQVQFNLINLNVVSAYTYIDIDNDGDLDIVTAGLNGPTNLYINNETKNNSITFEFRDKKGNYFGIGNKVYIYYGENSERHQVREIKLGGGFLSFDSPIAHFGLGEYDTVSRVEVAWSTGERTIIKKEFLANTKYVFTRN